MKKIVVFSGAGVSAESGIKTFRDQNGLWENHDINEVATPQAWAKNPALVLKFYNQRRKQMFEVSPNSAHKAIAKLEKYYDVTDITQNVDDLHERAGSSNVIHLHGELKNARCEKENCHIYDFRERPINLGDFCENGHQLRPDIVWFGEMVPMMEKANFIASTADIFIVVGTSLNVYPAAGIIHYLNQGIPCYLIDPNIPQYNFPNNWEIIEKKAGSGMPELYQKLTEDLK